jgi:putative ABC transport system permease protein
MPIGNVLRSPRRTALTALGIGAAIATLIVVLGMMDAFFAAMDRNDRELLQARPDRVAVALDGFVAEDGAEVRSVRAAASVGRVEPIVRVAATLRGPSREPVDAILEAVDFTSGVWRPTAVDGRPPVGTAGIVIAEKAAADLGVGIGDDVTVEHPARRGDGIAMVRSVMRVAAIHPSPFRFYAFVDRSQLAAFGAEGLTNELYVLPAPGHTPDQVERDLFTLDGVASVQPVAAASKIVKDSMDEFTAIFRVLEGFILLLALLIAYNATSINADERARERATLFAFGLRLRRVIALEVGEGLLIGVAGTLVGIGVGLGVVQWLTENTLETTIPDMGLDVVISAGTVALALVLGVLAVGVAPLLTVRRLRRMDIPGTLRVVE